MKKKLLGIVLVLSLLANVVMGISLYRKTKDNTDAEQGFLREISFAISRFEGYLQQAEESEYTVAIAHLYSAWVMLGDVETDKWIFTRAEVFHELWTAAALYPQQFGQNLEELIAALKQVKLDDNGDGMDAISKLSGYAADVRKRAE